MFDSSRPDSHLPYSSGLYQRLRVAGELPLRHVGFLDNAPAGVPLAWERLEGMMLGLAIGDALGNTSEAVVPEDRRAVHGEVRDYLPNRYAGWARVGLPSDDSQMAFWTLEHFLEHGTLVPEQLAQTFGSRHIFGIGQTVSAFRMTLRSGEPWERAAVQSAGNGALMRIAPVLLPHAAAPSPALWHDTVLLARLTHNDTASVSSCVAFVHLLWHASQMTHPPSGHWWADTFLRVLDDVCQSELYYPYGGAITSGGTFPALVRARLEHARRSGWDTVTGCNHFLSGAFLLETVPCVLWILERHAHDPEEAIVRAVNDTFDNDTVASIVGAAVGALHGASQLPERWRNGLTGRTAIGDDGRMQQLLLQARRRFYPLSGESTTTQEQPPVTIPFGPTPEVQS